ncbi:MAG: aldose 1-epimerase family protein [Ruminococcaceae bacterium]|nr:aldose 1-epimerase family protein [Oscillospiraceae bacterium]
MVLLKNDSLTVEISEKGAEIRRLTFDGKDRFWSGDPKVWGGVAPVLFPICGGLKDNKFTVNGKEYELVKHGFAKLMDFSVESATDGAVTFLLTETEETLKSYPWNFEFRVTYILKDSSLKIEYDVKNTSNTVMYTAVGGHEGYACDEGIEDYDIIFEKEETLKAHPVIGTVIARECETVLLESKTLPLYDKYFDVDALVFSDIKSRFLTLRNRKTGEKVSVEFNGFDYLLIWTKPGAKYICIEPWTCLPAFVDDNYAIEEKLGMTAISPNEHFYKERIIYF